MRIDPAPSVPSATPHSPAATAAPDPPLDPPGVRSSVPRVAGDAERRRLGERPDHQLGHVRLADDDRARGAQAADDLGVARRAGVRSEASVPRAVASPATSVSSLIATGTPSSGRSSPARRRASAWSASASARSAKHDAVGVELRVERARCASSVASTSSRADTSPAAMSRPGARRRRRRGRWRPWRRRRLVSSRDEPARPATARSRRRRRRAARLHRRRAPRRPRVRRGAAGAGPPDADRDALGPARVGGGARGVRAPPASRGAS